MMGIPPFFRAFAAQTAVEDRLAATPEALGGLAARPAPRPSRRALRARLRGSSHRSARGRPSTPPRCCTSSPRCCSGATRRAGRCASSSDAGRRSDAALERRPAKRCCTSSSPSCSSALTQAWQLPALLAETGRGAARRPDRSAHGRARRRGWRGTPRDGWDNAACPTTSPRSPRCSTSRRRGADCSWTSTSTQIDAGVELASTRLDQRRREPEHLVEDRRVVGHLRRAASRRDGGCRRPAASRCASGRRCCRSGSRSR